MTCRISLSRLVSTAVVCVVMVSWGSPLVGSSLDVPGIFGVSSAPASYSDEYHEMNLKLSQLEIVRKIPFVKLTHTERLSHVQGYVGNVRSGDIRGAARSVAGDFGQGNFARDVGVALATSVFTRVAQGATVDEAIGDTWSYVASSEFFFGQFLGGLVGGTAAAMIPIPVMGGLIGQALGSAPLLAGAMVGGEIGYGLVAQMKQGQVDVGAILREIDPAAIVFQSVGCAVGLAYGAFLPIPGVGSVVGGMIGGTMAMQLLDWIRERRLGPTSLAEERPVEFQGDGSDTVVAASTEDDASVDSDPVKLRELRDAAYREFVQAQESGDHDGALSALERLRLLAALP